MMLALFWRTPWHPKRVRTAPPVDLPLGSHRYSPRSCHKNRPPCNSHGPQDYAAAFVGMVLLYNLLKTMILNVRESMDLFCDKVHSLAGNSHLRCFLFYAERRDLALHLH